MSGGRLQREFLIAFASGLLVTPSLVAQQKFMTRRLMQSPSPPVATSPVPLPPEQMPTLAPKVQFQQGQLARGRAAPKSGEGFVQAIKDAAGTNDFGHLVRDGGKEWPPLFS